MPPSRTGRRARHCLRRARVAARRVIAVSPLVGGREIKGPLAENLRDLASVPLEAVAIDLAEPDLAHCCRRLLLGIAQYREVASVGLREFSVRLHIVGAGHEIGHAKLLE